MVGKRRDADAISAHVAEALRALVSSPKFEMIPLSNALDKAESLPAGATVTVTASPSHGIEATFDLAESVAAMGHEVIPHLSAHMIRGRDHLRDRGHAERAIHGERSCAGHSSRGPEGDGAVGAPCDDTGAGHGRTAGRIENGVQTCAASRAAGRQRRGERAQEGSAIEARCHGPPACSASQACRKAGLPRATVTP